MYDSVSKALQHYGHDRYTKPEGTVYPFSDMIDKVLTQDGWIFDTKEQAFFRLPAPTIGPIGTELWLSRLRYYANSMSPWEAWACLQQIGVRHENQELVHLPHVRVKPPSPTITGSLRELRLAIVPQRYQARHSPEAMSRYPIGTGVTPAGYIPRGEMADKVLKNPDQWTFDWDWMMYLYVPEGLPYALDEVLLKRIREHLGFTPTGEDRLPTPLFPMSTNHVTGNPATMHSMIKKFLDGEFTDQDFLPVQGASRRQGLTPTTGSSYKSYPTYQQKKIRVLHPSGATEDFAVPYNMEGFFQFGQLVWPVTDNVMIVPADHCGFSYGDPAFNPCVYQSTHDYLQAIWGRKLDDSDRKWLSKHPYSTDGGVPHEYTPTAVHQMVEPYNFGVSRISVKAGTVVLAGDLLQWAMALGCNPFALADHQTTNAQAVEKINATRGDQDPKMTLEEANQLWRFEFTTDPVRPGVIGETGYASQNGFNVGAQGGHARYIAPRGTPNTWTIALQLKPISEITYEVEPPNPEYVERRGKPVLIITGITDLEGRRLAKLVNSKWEPDEGALALLAEQGKDVVVVPETTEGKAPPPPQATTGAGTNTASSSDTTKQLVPQRSVSTTPQSVERNLSCDVCLTVPPYLCVDESASPICVDCASHALSGSECGVCHSPLKVTQVTLKEVDHGNRLFRYCCNRCKTNYTSAWDSDALHEQLTNRLFYHLATADLTKYNIRMPPASDFPSTVPFTGA